MNEIARPIASAQSAKIGIDEILALIRAELSPDENSQQTGTQAVARRRRAIVVPLLAEDDPVSQMGPAGLTIEAFEMLDEEAFLRTAYRLLLARDVDVSGRTHYLPALRDGRSSVVGILGALRFSAEGRARGIEVRGLRSAYFFDRVARTPVVGRIFGPVLRFAKSAKTLRRLHRRIAAADLRHRETIRSANESLLSLQSSLSQIEAETLRVEAVAEDTQVTAGKSLGLAQSTASEFAGSRHVIAESSRRLAQLIADVKATVPAGARSGSLWLEQLDEHALDDLYVAFENRFRGPKASISLQLERYLPILRASEPIAVGGLVLDVGCGRGEWLALLKDHNMVGRGVDLNEAMVAHSTAEGLDVIAGDAIAYLQATPEGSLAAITGFHIVEHLPFRVLVALLNECYRALAPGGIILFETPNPENLVVGACTFNYDPTHQKPLPPDLLRFLAETRGYVDTRIVRTDEDCQLDHPESGFVPTEINDWFRQPPNYALYARKPSVAEADAGAA